VPSSDLNKSNMIPFNSLSLGNGSACNESIENSEASNQAGDTSNYALEIWPLRFSV